MSTADESWRDCPAGEVDALARRLRSRTRMQAARRFTTGVVAMIAVGVTLFLAARDVGEPGYGKSIGGVWCSDVMELAEDYVAGRLDAAIMEQVTAHIAGCPSCREKIDELRAGSMPPPAVERRDARVSGEQFAGFEQGSGFWAVALQ